MGLDQANRLGWNVTHFVGTTQGELLTFDSRGGHAGGLPVTARTDTLNHCVDSVSVGYGVFEAFEHDDSDPLTRQNTVAVLIERAGNSALRERSHSCEHLKEGHVEEDVNPTYEHQIVLAGHQVTDRQIRCDQSGCTSRVDGVCRSRQVKTVCHPSCGDVWDQTRCGLRAETGEPGANGLFDLIKLGLGISRVQGLEYLQRLVRHRSALEQARQAGPKVTSPTQNECRPGATEVTFKIPGILHGLIDRSQHEELVRFSSLHRPRHGPAAQGIECK